MDAKEVGLGKIKGREPNPEYKIRQIWIYSYLRDYLAALTRGKEFLEPFHRYPDVIELNELWHRKLGQIRRATQNGKEHWLPLGFRDDPRAVFFPPFPFEGESGCIPAEVIVDASKWAYDYHGIIDFIGDIHSHPFGFEDYVRRLDPKTSEKAKGAFSAGDLYRAVHPVVFMPLTGVVDGNEDLFVFRTRETVETTIPTQDQFNKYWYERNGFKYQGMDKNHGTVAYPVTPTASTWAVNLDIAKYHRLIIYRGVPGQDLQRVTPR